MDSQSTNDSILSQTSKNAEENAKEIVTNVINEASKLTENASETNLGKLSTFTSELDKPSSIDLAGSKANTEEIKTNESSPYSDEKEQFSENSPEEFKDISGLLKQVNAQGSLDNLEDVSYDKVKSLDFPVTEDVENVPTKMPELSAYFGDPMTASIVDYDKFDDEIKISDSPKNLSPIGPTNPLEIVSEIDNFNTLQESSFLNEQPPEWLNLDDSKDPSFNLSNVEDTLDFIQSTDNPINTSLDLMSTLNNKDGSDFDAIAVDKRSHETHSPTFTVGEKSMSFDSNRGDEHDDDNKPDTSASTLDFSTEKDSSDYTNKQQPDDTDEFVSFVDKDSYVQENQNSSNIGSLVHDFNYQDRTNLREETNYEALLNSELQKPDLTIESENVGNILDELSNQTETLTNSSSNLSDLRFSTENVAFQSKPFNEEEKEEEIKQKHIEEVHTLVNDSDKFDTDKPILEHETVAVGDVAPQSTVPATFNVATATTGAALSIGQTLTGIEAPSTLSQFVEVDSTKVPATKTDSAMQENDVDTEEASTSKNLKEQENLLTSQNYGEPAAKELSEGNDIVLNEKTENTTTVVDKEIELSQFEVKNKRQEVTCERTSEIEQPTAQTARTEQEQQSPSSQPATTSSERSSSITKHLESADVSSSFEPSTKDIQISSVKPEQEPQPSPIMGRRSNRRENSQESNDNSTPDAVYEYIYTKLDPTVAELVYWRDAKASGIVFAAGLAILFSLTCFSVISVVSNTLMLAVVAGLGARIYTYVQQTLKKTETNNPIKEYLDFEFNPSKERTHEVVDQLLSQVTCFVNKMRSVLLVEDLVISLKYLIIFWVFTYLGAWFNGMTLIILTFIGAFSLPKVYENNKSQIDSYLDLINGKINEVTNKVPFLKKAEAEKEE